MDVKQLKKEELFSVSESLTESNIKELIDNLKSTDDKTRYPSFLILQFRSETNNDIYKYWNNFISMLNSDNSYFRTIGLKLIAINTKWDKENKFNTIIGQYLSFCEDEKLTTARLCIQGLTYVIEGKNYNKNICNKIVSKLLSIDLNSRPSTNLKVMNTDIVNVLMEIQKEIHYNEIVIYLNDCLTRNIIDNKLKNEIRELLK